MQDESNKVVIVTPAIKLAKEKQDEEVKRFGNDKVELLKLEQEIITLKSQAQFHDKLSEVCLELTTTIKELRKPLLSFLSSSSEETVKLLVQKISKEIDARLLKMLVGVGLVDPGALDDFNRSQMRGRAAKGEAQIELDVGSKVMADLGNDLNIG